MDISLLVLSAALVIAATIAGFLLRRPQAPRDPRLDEVIRGQGDIQGRFQQTVEAQAALQKLMAEKIEALDQRLGETLKSNAVTTAQTITGIGARLTVIDEAQKNISALSGQVVSLQQILANKQTRGAFGQAQMEEIVRDGLPANLYEFQHTLSNRSRPDCIIRIPGAKAMLVIDSKFPLEGFELLRGAANEDDKRAAMARVRSDVQKHVSDIAEKYLIQGETQYPAIMFVPSESIYADLHEGFSDVIQRAHKAHVMVVSPNILMLAINVIHTVMKDARMREQADLIRKEVGVLLQDVRRLGERVTVLQKRFGQIEGDIKDVTISTDKIISRGDRIERVELVPEEQRTLL